MAPFVPEKNISGLHKIYISKRTIIYNCRFSKVSAPGKRWSGAYYQGFFVNPWTAARQAPLSMGFSRQEGWSGLPFPPPGDLPDPGMETKSPTSPALQVDSLPCALIYDIYFSLSDLLHSA